MKAKQQLQEELKGWGWLQDRAKDRAAWLGRILKGNPDQTGIAGPLVRLQDDIISIRDKEIPLVVDVLRGILDAFMAERQRAGKSEKAGTKAFYIRHAVEEITHGRVFDADDGEGLPERVADWLEDNGPEKFLNLCDEDKEIRRVLRRMGYIVPKPDRT